jgi:hypothetical protein
VCVCVCWTGYDLSEAGMLSVLPYVFNFISVMSSGRMFDYLVVSE